MSERVGVVIPAFQPNIDLLLEYIDDIAKTLDPATIRIELDAPEDETEVALAETPATVNSVPQRRGKGGAITTGFDALETDILAFADADGSTPATELQRIVDAVGGGSADLALGSRRHPDASIETDQPILRAIVGDSFPWIARRILSVSLHDYQCGAKAITAAGWQRVSEHLASTGFAWDIELVAFADALDMELAEVPIQWHNHPESTVPPIQTAFELGLALVRTRVRTARLDSRQT